MFDAATIQEEATEDNWIDIIIMKKIYMYILIGLTGLWLAQSSCSAHHPVILTGHHQLRS